MGKLLKGLSILEVVLGIIGLIMAVLLLTGGGMLENAAQTQGEQGVVISFFVTGVVMLLAAVFNLACGICGMKGAAGDQKKLSTAIILGWLGVIAAAISAAMTLIGNVNTSTVISAVCSAIVPVLFLISAKSQKN